MSWIKRHLNWSMLIAFVVIALVIGSGTSSSSKTIAQSGYMFGGVLFIIFVGCVLKQKKRSLLYLLFFLIPFVGWMVPVFIPSGKPQGQEKEADIETSVTTVNTKTEDEKGNAQNMIGKI